MEKKAIGEAIFGFCAKRLHKTSEDEADCSLRNHRSKCAALSFQLHHGIANTTTYCCILTCRFVRGEISLNTYLGYKMGHCVCSICFLVILAIGDVVICGEDNHTTAASVNTTNTSTYLDSLSEPIYYSEM